MKYLLYFSLLVFHFSLCKAQDTLVYKTGEKVGVKVISINGGKVIYTLPPDEKQLSVNQAKLYYVKYKDGSRYSIVQSKSPSNKGALGISGGIGFSFITWALPNSNAFNMSGELFYKILTISPAYNLTFDYNVANHFSFGLSGAYQSLTDNPYLDGTNFTWETERITRKNISFRFITHLSKKPTHDAYLGVRVGMSIWTDDVIAINTSVQGGSAFTSMPSYSERGSFQLFFGYRTFLSNIFGIHIEAGIGSPYLIEAGITFRFQTEKNNE